MKSKKKQKNKQTNKATTAIAAKKKKENIQEITGIAVVDICGHIWDSALIESLLNKMPRVPKHTSAWVPWAPSARVPECFKCTSTWMD